MTDVRISGVPDDHKLRITGLRQPYVTETGLIIVKKPKHPRVRIYEHQKT